MRALFLLVAVSPLALVACGRNDPDVGNCGSVRQQYLGGNQGDTAENFSSLDLETRYRIYMCANQGVHPHRGLDDEFARGGADAAQFLAQKLRNTEYDLTIYQIVIVFASMREIGTYDASADPALMLTIEQKVALLHGALRESAERYVQTIKDGYFPGEAPSDQPRPSL